MIADKMLFDKYLLNVNIIESIRRESAEVLFESMDCILIKDREADMYLISAESMESAEKAISFIPEEADLILAHQDFYCDMIQEKCNLKEEVIITYHVVWTRKGHINVPKFDGEIKTLTLDNLEDVKKNYRLFDVIGEKIIRERIVNGIVSGAFIDGKLCGFIGEHEEGSIGMLEVFPEYRRKGLGYILEASSINKVLDKGRVPFGEVMIKNEASLKLQEKMGLEVAKEKCYWLE